MAIFTVGDLVYLVNLRGPNSSYIRSIRNPFNTEGLVIAIKDALLPIEIQWANGETNTYIPSNLIHAETPRYVDG